jgi:hypothetical protein
MLIATRSDAVIGSAGNLEQERQRMLKQSLHLSWGEYILPDQSQNIDLAGARWKFMEVVRGTLPSFFEQLALRRNVKG